MTNKTFEEIFEELARHNDRSVIWNNWLEYVIEINQVNHNGKKTNFHNNEETYIDLMEAWLNELNTKLETEPYYDILGHFYEELVQSKAKGKSLGQVYTPQSVTKLLSEIAIEDQFTTSDNLAYDPTCGSSRTLLSAHVESKGDLICIGQDIDLTSCHMSVLNFFSHGVRGSILHMDTIEEKFYQGWRINKYLYHGIPVPHIEEIHSVAEAFDFIELKNKPSRVIENYDNNNEADKEVVIPAAKQTGQTTLI